MKLNKSQQAAVDEFAQIQYATDSQVVGTAIKCGCGVAFQIKVGGRIIHQALSTREAHIYLEGFLDCKKHQTVSM